MVALSCGGLFFSVERHSIGSSCMDPLGKSTWKRGGALPSILEMALPLMFGRGRTTVLGLPGFSLPGSSAGAALGTLALARGD